jgi:transcriptional regulator
MPPSKNDLLQGTLDLLILQVLFLEPMHGWGISERIQQMSDDTFQVNQGSLYPALQRLKRKGYVTTKWRVTRNNRRARYYTLTRSGGRQLAVERETWRRSAMAIERILKLQAAY